MKWAERQRSKAAAAVAAEDGGAALASPDKYVAMQQDAVLASPPTMKAPTSPTISEKACAAAADAAEDAIRSTLHSAVN